MAVPAIVHGRADLLVCRLVSRERFGAELGVAALDAQKNTRPVQEDARFESFSHEPRGLQHVDEANRALEGHGMEGDERLLSRCRFDVLENLLFVVDEVVALFVLRSVDRWHVSRSLFEWIVFPQTRRPRAHGAISLPAPNISRRFLEQERSGRAVL